MSADPWRDLAVVNQFTRRGSGDLADRSDAPSWRARLKYRVQDEKYLTQECADAWRDFGQQPGTHLRWARAGPVRSDLRTAGQQTIASLRYGLRTTLSTGGRTFTWKRVTGSSGPDVAETVHRSNRESGPRHFFDASALPAKRKDGVTARAVLQLRELLDEMGTPILYISGRRMARAFITFPDQRWLQFPVRGTTRANAIMTAVDQAGNKVARYRMIGSQLRWNRAGRVEITVHPGHQLTDELALAIVISAPWLRSYFHPGGGG
jgi:hypothetical protein